MWLFHFLCFILIIGFHAGIVNSNEESENVHPYPGKEEIVEIIKKSEAPKRFGLEIFREKLRKLELEYNNTLKEKNTQ